MTKEITKAYILQEIEDKFKLRELDPDVFAFSETVVPTYDIASHLSKWEVEYFRQTITGGPGGTTFLSPPGDERWFIRRYNVIFVTGSFTVAGLMIYRPTVTGYIYVDLTAGQSTSYQVNLSQDIELKSTDILALYIDAFTSSGDLELRVDVRKEKIR